MKMPTRLAALATLVVLASCTDQGQDELFGKLGLTTHQDAQRKTVKDIRDIGTAMFGWLSDQVGAAAAGQRQGSLDVGEYMAISHAELEKVLVPEYLAELPELDGWGHPYELYLNQANPLGARVMSVRSPGRDGKYSASLYEVAPFEFGEFDTDIVWADGFFVQWPEGEPAKQAVAEPGTGGSIEDQKAQKRTLTDMRTTGTALYSWLTDQVGAAAAGQEQHVDLGNYSLTSHGAMTKLLVPQYLEKVPQLDGWGHPYEFRVNVADLLNRQLMSIRSPGRNGKFSVDVYETGPFEPDDFDRDIVWADGYFVKWPKKE